VIVIDADPNRHLTAWSKLPGKPDALSVISEVNEQTMLKTIAAASAKAPFVIIDLEGTASLMTSYAITRSDLVIIPMQGSHMDASQGARIFELISNQSEISQRVIPFSVLYTRVAAAIQPKTLQHIRAEISAAGIHALPVELIDREAYRAIFSFGGTVSNLGEHGLKNLGAAVENARAYFAAVIDVLKSNVEAK
jgi:chromosome partitioning protein